MLIEFVSHDDNFDPIPTEFAENFAAGKDSRKEAEACTINLLV